MIFLSHHTTPYSYSYTTRRFPVLLLSLGDNLTLHTSTVTYHIATSHMYRPAHAHTKGTTHNTLHPSRCKNLPHGGRVHHVTFIPKSIRGLRCHAGL